MTPARTPFAISATFIALLVASVSLRGEVGGFDHGNWPFRPPAKPNIPNTENNSWVHNPVDRFVLHKLESVGLEPSDEADKLTLLRRVMFDLTGLPPTLAQQRAFIRDTSPGAYDRLVEQLLTSPRFGERWGQHWLDVVRYAETEGFKADTLRPLAHQYRDYVIRSFNSDRPCDEFVCQQLAGDELEPDNPQAIIATGLNRLYPDENNAANLFQRREEILTDVTETTGLALMGLTMGCAQCHDHKFDDILQTDFYRLRAFFAGIVERDDRQAATSQERQAYAKQFTIWEQATASTREEMDKLLAEARHESDQYNLEKFRQEIRDCVALPAEDRTPLQEQIARFAIKQLSWRFDAEKATAKLPEQQQRRYAELAKEVATFDGLKPEPLPRAMAISDVGPEAPPTYLFANGNWQTPEDVVEPGFPKFLGEVPCEIPNCVDPTTTTGRRSALAQWLTRPDHPLTARVIVNRLWQHHFGRGIVKSPNDFGVMGDEPTHPQLLDWLAVELVEHGWSLKHIHRLMVTSATYRQTSEVDHDNPSHAIALKTDGENALLWHARRRRLEGEGTKFRSGSTPILHLHPTEQVEPSRQREQLDFIQQLNKRHKLKRSDDDQLEARIAAYELAYRMQSSAPEAIDLRDESEKTRALYGIDRKETTRNGSNCLLARRLVERGVRFVQLYMGSGGKWDAHSKLDSNHSRHCLESDQPIAGLLKDLKQRGMLQDTLVVWGGEFGRTPMSESGDGRDHNPYGFTMWMAGGGIQGGVTYGATDEIGLYITENQAHVHDIHATILHCLGLDHEQLTYFHNGRDERATINGGTVIDGVLA